MEILSELFVDTKDPTYLFNQGRCFEQNRRYEDAIARFQEYLRASQGRVAESDKASAEQHITDCKAMLPQQSPASATPEAFTPPPPPPETATPQPSATRPPAEGVVAATVPVSNPGSGLRIAGIITASVGVAGLVTGLVLNLKANGIVQDMETTKDGYSTQKTSDRQSFETGAWLSYGLGAACVATGAVLYGIGLAKATPSVAVLPTVGVGQAGAAIVGAF